LKRGASQFERAVAQNKRALCYEEWARTENPFVLSQFWGAMAWRAGGAPEFRLGLG
jgi:hypothetical protein